MRLSFLALFIALPAAAYAAVYPRQLDSLNNMVSCLTNGLCDSNNKCCTGLQCVPIGEYHVRLIVHLL